MKFSLRDLFWLTLVVALAALVFVKHQKLTRLELALKKERISSYLDSRPTHIKSPIPPSREK